MTLTTDGLVIFQDQYGHRIAYHPGNDLSSASQEVTSLASQLWTPEAIAEYRALMVSLEPETGPPAPTPAFSNGWAEVIISPLYQRALQLAFGSLAVNTAMTLFGMAYQAHRDLNHEVWASALSASAGHLAMAINASSFTLTTEEMTWIIEWSERNYLGLTFPWEGTDGE